MLLFSNFRLRGELVPRRRHERAHASSPGAPQGDESEHERVVAREVHVFLCASHFGGCRHAQVAPSSVQWSIPRRVR